MNRSYLSAAAFAVIALTASQTFAADTALPKTRAEVKAELAEAIRTGDIVAPGESGRKLNELFPNQYPAKAVTQSKTRAQVQAELVEAIRSGDIVAAGDSGKKLNELFPNRYNAVN
ncbi:MAG: DUF4148 domain-containing protein [Hydrogenophaga sp.]|uniref:DUF4148 domain-containing protein n=1 Tax=Hydrogenophaga sp. TaxID=1904254 RepID=UPI002731CA12|nr:DUF4148 domain-containing protein [Hydrogenophaga sp.]MDP2164168.1 DUF4148 domain-containing protein [Hydrogenophaga sp.]MDP3474973.1 DUF4148 domain-containing protein [Hydrogenophaga sp.]